MESILLIGHEKSGLRSLKAQLVKKGFEVTALEWTDLDSLDQTKGRFSLGVLEPGPQGALSDWVSRLKKESACKDLPLLALVGSKNLGQLSTLRGLEDFLIAPALPEMIELKVRFLLNRLNHLSPPSGIQIGALKIDPERYEVTLDGEPLELTYKEFELLKFLATHPEKVFSRDQLLNQVWGYDFIGGGRTVDVHVRRLRAKLGPKYASLIDTVRNVGYKFLESL